MKNKFLVPMGIMLLSLSSFTFSPEEEALHVMFAKDYVSTTCSQSLNERFEIQFSGMIKTVEQVDIHFNADFGYYYKVSGISPSGSSVIEYFKTTEEEVSARTYNYIKLSKETTGLSAQGVCKFLPRYGCVRASTGITCGVVRNGVCLIF